MRRPLAIAASLVTLVLAACGDARDGGGSASSCGSCHGFAPATPAHGQLADGAQDPSRCGFCHPSSVSGAGDLLAGHGTGGATCAGCHDPLPPADAHLAHVSGGTWSRGFACTACHPADAVTDPAHGSDGLDVSFATAIVPGGTYAAGLCATTYCHGAFSDGSGADPTWTGTTIGCSSCHGAPPTSGDHSKHLGMNGVTCATCHPGYAASSVNLATHVDGLEQVVPLDESAADQAGTWDAATRSCALECHGEPHAIGAGGMNW